MLPVLFVLSTISCLYLIYVIFHCLPLLQLSIPPNQVDDSMRYRGVVQCIVFHVITLLMILCYVRCVLVYPGQVPDMGWWYQPNAKVNFPMLERKQNGEYRNCRRCGKYKPDRCHHCSVCGVCVLKMDHHCPWIYNCVGFHNYKFFFLLLFYVTLDTHLIFWTSVESMIRAVDENAPFITMFSLLFGLSLCFFLGTVISLFFSFHVWLMLQAMTTIEFCEKKGVQQNIANYESVFNMGILGNIQSTLGQNPLCWLLPIAVEGDGLTYAYDPRQLSLMGRDLEGGRGSIRKGSSRKLLQPPAQDYGAIGSAGSPAPWDYGAVNASQKIYYQRAQRPSVGGGPCVR